MKKVLTKFIIKMKISMAVLLITNQQSELLELLILGIISAILGIIIYNFLQSCSLYYMFRNISGEYYEYDNNGVKKDDSILFVKFPKIRNFLWFGYSLTIKQKCKKRGDWNSIIPIHPDNPFYSTGFFKYSTVNAKAWGIHNITINLTDNIIYIEAQVKNQIDMDPNRYWIKK